MPICNKKKRKCRMTKEMFVSLKANKKVAEKGTI